MKKAKKFFSLAAACFLAFAAFFASCELNSDSLISEIQAPQTENDETESPEPAPEPEPQDDSQSEEAQPEIFAWTAEPKSACFLQGQQIAFSCKAECGSKKIYYRWFECDSDGQNKTPLGQGWSQEPELLFEAFKQKGVRYFLCAAYPVAQDLQEAADSGSPFDQGLDEIPEGAVFSSLAAAAYTGLPLISISTGDVPTENIYQKENYVPAQFSLCLPDGTRITHSLLKKGIKARGNSSFWMPKHSFNLNFDSAVSFFDLPKAKKWCLTANYADKSLLRNKYASVLGNELYNAEWNPSFYSVDVEINGEYMGNYLLCEKITLGAGRVDIQDISDCTEKKISKGTYADQNGDGVADLYDGGFILEIDGRLDEEFHFYTEQGVPVCAKDPDDIEDSGTKEHMQALVQNAETLLYSDEFKSDAPEDSEQSKWMQLLDADSFVDWYIVNEFSKNIDARFATSVYMFYNPADGKFHMGPNWDFDIGFGLCTWSYVAGIMCNEPGDWYIKSALWISRLFEDPRFVQKLKARWNEKKSRLQAGFSQDGIIQKMADENAASAEMNFFKWDILEKDIWPNTPGYEDRLTFQSEVDYFKEWCQKRFDWMDAAINAL